MNWRFGAQWIARGGRSILAGYLVWVFVSWGWAAVERLASEFKDPTNPMRWQHLHPDRVQQPEAFATSLFPWAALLVFTFPLPRIWPAAWVIVRGVAAAVLCVFVLDQLGVLVDGYGGKMGLLVAPAVIGLVVLSKWEAFIPRRWRMSPQVENVPDSSATA